MRPLDPGNSLQGQSTERKAQGSAYSEFRLSTQQPPFTAKPLVYNHLICFSVHIKFDLSVSSSIWHIVRLKTQNMFFHAENFEKESLTMFARTQWQSSATSSDADLATRQKAQLPCFNCHKHSFSWGVSQWQHSLQHCCHPFLLFSEATCGHSLHSWCLL